MIPSFHWRPMLIKCRESQLDIIQFVTIAGSCVCVCVCGGGGGVKGNKCVCMYVCGGGGEGDKCVCVCDGN